MLKSEYSMKIKDQNYMENVACQTVNVFSAKINGANVKLIWSTDPMNMMPPAPILNIGMITPPPKFEKKVGIAC